MGTLYSFSAGDSANTNRLDWENIPLDPGPHPEGISGIAKIPHGHIPDRGNHANGVGSGFGWTLERPIIRIKPSRSGRPPNDIEHTGRGLKIVSDAAKRVCEQVDPEAFEFEPTTTVQRVRGVDQPGPVYWLCDVVRFIDALDESDPNTEVEIRPNGQKMAYGLWPMACGKRLPQVSHRRREGVQAHVFSWRNLDDRGISEGDQGGKTQRLWRRELGAHGWLSCFEITTLSTLNFRFVSKMRPPLKDRAPLRVSVRSSDNAGGRRCRRMLETVRQSTNFCRALRRRDSTSFGATGQAIPMPGSQALIQTLATMYVTQTSIATEQAFRARFPAFLLLKNAIGIVFPTSADWVNAYPLLRAIRRKMFS